MEVIAKTESGVIISATTKEVVEILRSVTGEKVEKISIGQKIPAIDYAASITKVKELNKSYEFGQICNRLDSFNQTFGELKESIENAALLEI